MLRPEDKLEERYIILGPEPLGQGGMGKVWRAKDKKIGMIVAVKEFEPDPKAKLTEKQKKSLQDLFTNEAELLAGLEHEAFPKVRDRCFYNQTPCIVMDYVSGEDFDKRLEQRRSQPFEIELIYDWLDQILGALEYLHNLPNPVIHKDIKPSNLKLTSNNHIKILDFGIAKGYIGEMTVPRFSLPLGTINYAPLEQALKASVEYHEILSKRHKEKVAAFINQNTTPQSDIFALCATIYRLLAGVPPQIFNSPSRASFIWNNEPDPLPNLYILNSNVPVEFSDLIKKGMNLDIKDRIKSAAEMRVALKDFRQREHQNLKNQERQGVEEELKSRFEHQLSELRINAEQKSREASWIIEEKNREIEGLKNFAEELKSTKVSPDELNRIQASAQLFEKQLQETKNNFPGVKKQIIQNTVLTFSQNLIDSLTGKALSGSDEFDTQDVSQAELKLTASKIKDAFSLNSPTSRNEAKSFSSQKEIAMISSVYTLVLPLPLIITGYFFWSTATFTMDITQKVFWLGLVVPLLSLIVPIFSLIVFYLGEKALGTIAKSKVITRYIYKFIFLVFALGIGGAILGLVIDHFRGADVIGIIKGNLIGMFFGYVSFYLLFYRDLRRK